MGATAAPVLYGLHSLVRQSGGHSGLFDNPLVAPVKAAANAVPTAAAAPSPSALGDARVARDAAALARRRAAALGGRSGTLLTGGAGLVNEPAPQRATLLGA